MKLQLLLSCTVINAVAVVAMYDVVIIGGGIVGCSVLHELTSRGYHCLLVEKESELLTGASSGNR